MRSTDSDNPIYGWSDQQLAEAARNTLRTLEEIAQHLRNRGYTIRLGACIPNFVPTVFTATKAIIL